MLLRSATGSSGGGECGVPSHRPTSQNVAVHEALTGGTPADPTGQRPLESSSPSISGVPLAEGCANAIASCSSAVVAQRIATDMSSLLLAAPLSSTDVEPKLDCGRARMTLSSSVSSSSLTSMQRPETVAESTSAYSTIVSQSKRLDTPSSQLNSPQFQSEAHQQQSVMHLNSRYDTFPQLSTLAMTSMTMSSPLSRPPTDNSLPVKQSFSVSNPSFSTENQALIACQTDLRRKFCDRNVFVFHLPSEWTEQDLRCHFEPFGEILSARVVKRPDGKSRGYGFVCYHSNTAAANAVKEMNGRFFGGKWLKVSLKKTPEECLRLQVEKLLEISKNKQPYERFRDCTLFVFHLPADWDETTMRKHFQRYGNVVYVKVAKKKGELSCGYGFVTYDTPYSAAVAILNMNGLHVGQNKRLKVQLKQQTNSVHPIKPDCTIFVFHIPSDWTDATLRQYFAHYGKIWGASVQRDAEGKSRGYGFIGFDSPESAATAVAGMNGFCVGRKRLKVSLKRNDNREYSYSPISTSSCACPVPITPTFNPTGFWDISQVEPNPRVITSSSAAVYPIATTQGGTACDPAIALRNSAVINEVPLSGTFPARSAYAMSSTGPAVHATIGDAALSRFNNRARMPASICPSSKTPDAAIRCAYPDQRDAMANCPSLETSGAMTPNYSSFYLGWNNV